MTNEHFWVSSTGTSYPRNYVLKSIKVLGFTKEHRTADHPTALQLMDDLPRVMILNALAALILFIAFPSNVYSSARSPIF
jgi:hypothetical protein